MPEYIKKQLSPSSWKRGNNLEPRVICSTMKATRRSMVPEESMRDESSLMIIEKEERQRTKGNKNVEKDV